MANDIHLFLDLEETLIDEWTTKNIINIDKIKQLITEINPSTVHIFSAAIWNINDINEFNNELRYYLNTAFNIRIDKVVSMKTAKKFSSWKTYNSTIQELLLTIGKFKLFIDFCKSNYSNCTCILIDDMCDNEIITNSDLNLKIQMIRI